MRCTCSFENLTKKWTNTFAPHRNPKLVYVYFQVLIFPLTLFRVTALVIFADYDTKCMILEHASVIDCHQDEIVSNPVLMILAWLVTSNLSTLFFFLIVCGEHKLLPFQFDKAKQWKNYRSFLRILPSLILTEIYYIIRLSVVPSHAGRAISFFLPVWQGAMTLVAYRFRYIRPVKWNEPAGCLNKFLYLFYWRIIWNHSYGSLSRLI